VYDNDMSHSTSTTESREKNGWKYEFSDVCRKLAGTVQTWRDVAVCSRHEQQRSGKLGRPTFGNRVRRTISDDDDAEQRVPRASRSG